jgi:DNA-binding transcriptional MerR regulator
MRIRDAAERSGLSIDTIRFYEKSGMLPAIARGKRGWRDFSADQLDWLITLERLRATGMPLKAVKRFAVLVHAAPEDAAAAGERLAILEEHRERLAERRRQLDACEAYLIRKIAIHRAVGDL